MQFADQCSLLIKAGNGGNGIVAWRREAHYPEGGPFGGEGGKGGDVIILGDENINSLFHLRYQKKIVADNGQNGQNKQMAGRNGQDKIIKVPVGTQIFNKKTGELIVDILKDKQEFVIAKGGIGGHGNAYFKSSLNKAPTLYENGDKGETIDVEMKLKFIADIGLVGLPNAGKSSLITCLSNARPKIANYQFTTLAPVLGTINFSSGKPLVIADIPGLIEGASEGVGLGFDFLKHIERCHILIHVISLDEMDHEDIVQGFNTINNELNKYNKLLLKKQLLVVANKCDCPSAETQLKKLKKIIKKKDSLVVVSAKDKINLEELKSKILALNDSYLQQQKVTAKQEAVKVVELRQKKFMPREFTFEKDKAGRWIIHSEYLSYWLYKIPQTTKDNIFRFNQKLNNCNIDNILKKHGAKPKDTIIIDNVEFQLD
ncbi:MAG: GTPase ObgE [Mycoplasmoidaceae bacterium]